MNPMRPWIVLSLLALLEPATSIWAVEAPGPYFIRADANGDGEVDIADAVYILLFLFRSEGFSEPPYCLDALDVNDDGRVDVSDPTFLLNFLFKGGPSPPLPGRLIPGGDRLIPGGDPTPDSLTCNRSLPGLLSIEVSPTSWVLPGVSVHSTYLTGENEHIQITNTGKAPQAISLQLIPPSGWEAGTMPGFDRFSLSALIAQPDDRPLATDFNREGIQEDVLSLEPRRATSTVFSYPGTRANGGMIQPSERRTLSLLLSTPTQTTQTDEQQLKVVITAELP